MGWKEGTGLGTEGEGRVDPMSVHSFLFSLGNVYLLIRHSSNSQTNIYSSGVGLGASKGREVGKYKDDYSGYVQMTRDAISL